MGDARLSARSGSLVHPSRPPSSTRVRMSEGCTGLTHHEADRRARSSVPRGITATVGRREIGSSPAADGKMVSGSPLCSTRPDGHDGRDALFPIGRPGAGAGTRRSLRGPRRRHGRRPAPSRGPRARRVRHRATRGRRRAPAGDGDRPDGPPAQRRASGPVAPRPVRRDLARIPGARPLPPRRRAGSVGAVGWRGDHRARGPHRARRRRTGGWSWRGRGRWPGSRNSTWRSGPPGWRRMPGSTG